MSDFDYVTVGHVTVDVLADGARRPGGGAFYSALQAARLGSRTLIVTKGVPEEVQELLAPYSNELQLHVYPAEHTTTLLTTGLGSERKQHILAWAGAMGESIAVDTSILHLAAVARETPSHWQGHAEFVGITPQGLMRAWDERGEISQVSLAPNELPAHVDAAAISEAELPDCRWLSKHTLLAVTAGSRPTLVHQLDGTILQAPTPVIDELRDDLGAGDVFAAAFFIALHEGRPPIDAATYGNAAATVRIAGAGPQAVGDRGAIAAVPRR